jgi:predicted CxxxxCH...CXXCH cytochrome family protein
MRTASTSLVVLSVCSVVAAFACGGDGSGAGSPDAGQPLIDTPAATETTPAADGTTPSPDATAPPSDAITPPPDATTPPPDSSGGGPHKAGFADPTKHGAEAKVGLANCTACHGADLGGGSSGQSCEDCHAGWQKKCTFCHGGKDNQSGAPPVSVAGQVASSASAVGAHSSHVMGPAKIAAAIDCSACHAKPADALATGHIDPSPAEVAAAKGGAYAPASGTCASTWCHGGFPGGNAANTPKWTGVGSGGAACGTCHAIGPSTGKHPAVYGKHKSIACSKCHADTVDSAKAIVDPTRHVNGTKDVKVGSGTWDPAKKSCDPACHGKESW